MTENRIDICFQKLKQNKTTAYIPFITAGYPNYQKSLEILLSLPENGGDIIELGMPFSDPMADGPVIQKAAHDAIKEGQSMQKNLNMARLFRQKHQNTPLILMGYYNLVLAYGKDKFVQDCKKNGVDALIIVDLPSGQEEKFCAYANQNNLYITQLAATNTPHHRIRQIASATKGFLYYVMVKGVTGTKKASYKKVCQHIQQIKKYTSIPIAVGFGVKKPQQAAQFAKNADAVIVGSAIIEKIGNSQNIQEVLEFSQKIANAIHNK